MLGLTGLFVCCCSTNFRCNYIVIVNAQGIQGIFLWEDVCKPVPEDLLWFSGPGLLKRESTGEQGLVNRSTCISTSNVLKVEALPMTKSVCKANKGACQDPGWGSYKTNI
jgi:hypothetical protein